MDGNRLPGLHGLGKVLTARAIIDGDVTEPAISAASILAKTARDNYMNQMDTIYPAYAFASHKGYATPIISALLSCTGRARCIGALSSRCACRADSEP